MGRGRDSMKILYCITKSEWGGAQNHLYELIKGQTNKKNEIILIVGSEGSLTERIRNEKIKCKIIICDSLMRELSLIKDYKTIKFIRNILKKEKPDILHLHSSKAGAVGRVAAKNLKDIKVIFTAHGWAFTEGVNKIKARVYLFIEKYLSKYTDKIICVSKYDYNLALRNNFNKEKLDVIYNGVGVPQINLGNEDIPIENKVNFFFPARFASPKRQDLVIEAVKDLPQDRFKIHFLGEGPELERLKDVAEANNLSESIIFHGFVKNPRHFFTDKSILLLISDYEGLPISIIEGLSVGTPVVASNVGGVSELVLDNINGFLVENEVSSIKQTILKFIEKPKSIIDFSKESKRIYEEKFTSEFFLRSTTNIYLELLDCPRV